MSGKFGTAVMFFSLAAIAMAANRAEEQDAYPASGRAPSSVQMDAGKERILGPFKAAPGLRHTEKLRGPLSVALNSPSASAAVGEVFVVLGTLTTRKDLKDGCDFTWSLPAGVELVGGELKGHVNSLSAGQATLIQLTLRKVAAGNVQIHLLAAATVGGMRFADSAQFNSDAQPLGETNIPEQGKLLKIFH